MIRRAEHSDINFLLALGKVAYKHYDEEGAKTWLNWALNQREILLLRGELAAGCAIIQRTFFCPDPFCIMTFLASFRPTHETFTVFERMARWAAYCGVIKYKFGVDERAQGIDFMPFAERLKLPIRDISQPYYEMDLSQWVSSESCSDRAAALPADAR